MGLLLRTYPNLCQSLSFLQGYSCLHLTILMKKNKPFPFWKMHLKLAHNFSSYGCILQTRATQLLSIGTQINTLMGEHLTVLIPALTLSAFDLFSEFRSTASPRQSTLRFLFSPLFSTTSMELMVPAALLALTSSTWQYRTDSSQPQSSLDWSGLQGPVSPHPPAPLSLKSLSSSNIRCYKAALGTLKVHPDNNKKVQSWFTVHQAVTRITASPESSFEVYMSQQTDSEARCAIITRHSWVASLLLLRHISFSCLQYISFMSPSGSVKASYTLLICWLGPFILRN